MKAAHLWHYLHKAPLAPVLDLALVHSRNPLEGLCFTERTPAEAAIPDRVVSGGLEAAGVEAGAGGGLLFLET